MFYVPDTKLGKNWCVVQKFEHRHKFDVGEVDEDAATDIAYKEVVGSDNEGNGVSDVMPSVPLNRPKRQGRSIDAYEVERLMTNQKNVEEEEIDSEPEVDDTIEEYCSEKEDDQPDDTDED